METPTTSQGDRFRTERVRPGVWAVPLPLPAPPYRVVVYVLETDDGPYLVDAGWDTDEAWQALADGLAVAGTRIEEVRGVLVTHAHTDHYGLAPRIRAASGAWVGLHALDAEELHRYRMSAAERLAALLLRAGAPEPEADRVLAAAEGSPGREVPGPDRLLADGERMDVPGWDLGALWTPGHTPGHLCFWEPRHRLLLGGDHVLPHTVVAVREPRTPVDDPLGDYLGTFPRLAALEPTEVLPAHEDRYTGLAARLDRIAGYHAGRVDRVHARLREGPVTAWELSARMRPGGTLEGLRGYPLTVTVSRTLAALARLRAEGLARELPGPPRHWEPIAR